MRDKTSSKHSKESQSHEHPSRNLEPRARGYGIGGGYERPLRKRPKLLDEQSETYGPLPHSGYYGAGALEAERFKRGQASFNDELEWYAAQYGERTSWNENGRT